MSLPHIRRVVTGHDARGRSTVASDGSLPNVVSLQGEPGMTFHEVWSTAASPVTIDNGGDPTGGPLSLPPPSHGTRVRFVDFPPDSDSLMARTAAQIRELFREVGATSAPMAAPAAPHPLMHRTASVDYAVVIDGELVLMLDEGEVTLLPGSVVVQRGTHHAWANRSGKPCRMLFVLIDGVHAPDIAACLASRSSP